MNGQPLLIPPNLYDALEALRLASAPRHLWIDYICINQNDLVEKATQIPLMADIYRTAQQVLVWLGPSADDSDHVMRTIRDCNEEEMKSTAFQHRMLSLIHRRWFTRVWILQEFAVPTQDPVFLCGFGDPIPWKSLMNALNISMEAQSARERSFATPRTLMRRADGSVGWRDNFDYGVRVMGNIPAQIRMAQRDPSLKKDKYLLLKRLDELRKSVQSGNNLSLTNSLLWASGSGSTHSRDRVYGLLGMIRADDSRAFINQNPIVYDANVRTDMQVFQDATIWTLTHELPLIDHLYSHFDIIPNTRPGTPSWILDLKSEIVGSGLRWCSPARTDDDSAGTTRPSFSEDKTKMFTEGISVGTIEQVICVPPETHGHLGSDLHLQALRLGLAPFWSAVHLDAKKGWETSTTTAKYEHNMKLLVKLYIAVRELVQGRSNDEELTEPLMRTLVGWHRWDAIAEDDFRRLETVFAGWSDGNWFRETANYMSVAKDPAFLAFYSTMRTGSFFMCENGCYGVARKEVKKGDEVMLLFPDRFTPFILRKGTFGLEMITMATMPEVWRLQALQEKEPQFVVVL